MSGVRSVYDRGYVSGCTLRGKCVVGDVAGGASGVKTKGYHRAQNNLPLEIIRKSEQGGRSARVWGRE
ncbi:hypothetical protein E2C01_079205 [Portunus trituberculatus]|uniref:Uncharacterized protein n=1 Tax=Portunus trituberculatus TaxID=210409 RepID=A0A5B7ISP4_PORTR|nr:hypothetical protein [Portunus trituberculatus]